MNRLHALIFDVDGTLAETERDGHRPAFNAAFAEASLDWNWDEALYGRLLDITGGKERISHFAARHAPEIAGDADFAVLVRQLHLAKTAHYLRLVDQGRLPLRPGIARLTPNGTGYDLSLNNFSKCMGDLRVSMGNLFRYRMVCSRSWVLYNL
jgi:phosphoglycolate phosphatase-like HAD superfamily hydrolase